MMDTKLRYVSLSRHTDKNNIKVSLTYNIDMASKIDVLKRLYFDRFGFGSMQTTYTDAKEKDQLITMNDV